jgi:hypothetical protein
VDDAEISNEKVILSTYNLDKIDILKVGLLFRNIIFHTSIDGSVKIFFWITGVYTCY